MSKKKSDAAAGENGIKVGRPMNVYVTKDSPAGRAYEKARGLPIDPKILAPGLPKTPAQDLVFHGGKTIHDLHFVNYYVGGKSSWDTGEVTSIDKAIAGAMSDRQLNNVMAQYFDDDNISSKFERSEILEGDIPATFFKDTGEKLLENLHSDGKLDNFDLGSTVFNFILPKKMVLSTDLSTDLSGEASRSTQKKPNHRDNDNDEAGDKPFFPEREADSTRGLGGFHGSMHVGTGGGQKTIYYSFNVYSEKMDNGRINGIPVFDENWKNIVATLYHELNEARTDPDVGDVINGGSINLLGWNSRRGQECGDFPVEEAFGAGKPGLVMNEVAIDGNQIVPIQLQYSNFVHGPEGRIPNPHPHNPH
jgi:hypothetical protein